MSTPSTRTSRRRKTASHGEPSDRRLPVSTSPTAGGWPAAGELAWSTCSPALPQWITCPACGAVGSGGAGVSSCYGCSQLTSRAGHCHAVGATGRQLAWQAGWLALTSALSSWPCQEHCPWAHSGVGATKLPLAAKLTSSHSFQRQCVSLIHAHASTHTPCCAAAGLADDSGGVAAAVPSAPEASWEHKSAATARRHCRAALFAAMAARAPAPPGPWAKWHVRFVGGLSPRGTGRERCH